MNVYKNTFARADGTMRVDIQNGERQNTIQYGDILFTQSSETVEEVGLTSVWLHDFTPYLNSFCMALRPYNLSTHDPIYLGYALRSDYVRRQIMKEGQGISRINLASSRIENILIPMPPKAVQNKMAVFLRNIDLRLESAEKTLELLTATKKGLLQRLFI